MRRSRTENLLRGCRSAAQLLIFSFGLAFGGAFADVLVVPQDFASVQQAIDAARAGDVIQVMQGVYAERLTINKSDIRVQGNQAILDGSLLGGIGTGVQVMGTEQQPLQEVEVRGLLIENFENGFILENATRSRIVKNEIRNSMDKDPSDGPFNNANGLKLVAASLNEIKDNIVRESGHEGITLEAGSSRNFIEGNQSVNNGLQTGEVAGGCGIQMEGDDTNDNLVVNNETQGNDWGILIGPFDAATGNVIVSNRSDLNHRAGVAVIGDGKNNILVRNKATGNGVLNLEPTFGFDLYEGGEIANIWLLNSGTANF